MLSVWQSANILVTVVSLDRMLPGVKLRPDSLLNQREAYWRRLQPKQESESWIAMTNEWKKPEHAEAYLARLTDIPHRQAGEATLLSEVPTSSTRVLDLGCGDGHLLGLVLAHCPNATGVGLDFSETMLQRARRRFADDRRAEVVEHDMDESLPDLGPYDCVVSSFAIHHCADQRKYELFEEVFALLQPSGVFCNLEHVSSPSDPIHARFVKAMGMKPEDEDPSNQLLDVETQLGWLRGIGFQEVDCFWKWRELALLVGLKPPQQARTAASAS